MTFHQMIVMRIRRRMIKFLGGSIEPKSDDKPTVKEADTINKIPAFPLAETYRNWRINTCEAVVAASTDLDNAVKWVSESWLDTENPLFLKPNASDCIWVGSAYGLPPKALPFAWLLYEVPRLL